MTSDLDFEGRIRQDLAAIATSVPDRLGEELPDSVVTLEAPRQPPRRRAAAVLTAAAVLVLVGGAGTLLLRSEPATTTTAPADALDLESELRTALNGLTAPMWGLVPLRRGSPCPCDRRAHAGG